MEDQPEESGDGSGNANGNDSEEATLVENTDDDIQSKEEQESVEGG